SSSDSDTNNNDVSNVKHYKMGAIEPFIKVTTITGSVFSGVNSHYMFTAKVDDNELSFSSLDLYDRGYEIEWINKCKAAITRDESTEYVYCSMDSLILPKFIAQNETEKEPNG
ncbi:MAG: hypothetical protein GY928_30685, partial [Colwellia sp.]|nr:hypothetical protein [Colwellia sp.]